jgi:hypothetical protein
MLEEKLASSIGESRADDEAAQAMNYQAVLKTSSSLTEFDCSNLRHINSKYKNNSINECCERERADRHVQARGWILTNQTIEFWSRPEAYEPRLFDGN